MEDVGHNLMAFRIDEQFLGILHSQFNQALEKFGTTNAVSLEGKAAVEFVFYLLSFGITGSGSNNMLTGTPGMQAVGLSVQGDVQGTLTTSQTGWLRAVLVLSYLTIKWSTLKLHEMSALNGWFVYPQGTLERRTEECLKIGRIVVKCMSALSFVVFLCKGDYPDLLYRVANIGTERVGSDARRGAGYNSAQLFVEGKKMLWLVLLGASAAATIAIDWRSLRYYCYFYVRSVLSTLHAIHNRGVSMVSRAAAAVVGVTATRERSVLSYVQSLFTRNATPTVQSDISYTDSSDDSPALIVDNGAGTSNSTNTSTVNGNNTNGQSLFNEGVTAPAVCSACHSNSPEMPHRVDCGHVYCYMCVHRLVASANSVSNYDTFTYSGGGGSTTASCVSCFASVSKYEPLSSL